MTEELRLSSGVGPVGSAADAEARLRVASAHLFAVSDWLARTRPSDLDEDGWCYLADGLAYDVRALARRIRTAADG